jgi:hypothetical protein
MSIEPRFHKPQINLFSCKDRKDAGLYMKSSFNTLTESFKVVMACLLSIFVPQNCSTTSDKVICGIQENIYNLTDWNKLVLAFNFITMGFFCILYLTENFRERFLIRYLDKNESKPDNNLLTALTDEYSDIRKRLYKYNSLAFYVYLSTLLLFVVNGVLSGILVFKDYYLDTRTITVFITNILLLSTKIFNGLSVAFESKKRGLAYSLTLYEPISWNVIDSDVAEFKKVSKV